MEIWEPIKGVEKYYLISNLGDVMALDRMSRGKGGCFYLIKSHQLNPCPDKIGYKRVLLYGDNGKIFKRESIHRLVAEAFIPNPENKKEVNHLNGIKIDNRRSNLEWATPTENRLHSFRMKLQIPKYGEKSNLSKLTAGKVLEIRELYATSKYTAKELGNKYNVGRACITAIINRYNWKHI